MKAQGKLRRDVRSQRKAPPSYRLENTAVPGQPVILGRRLKRIYEIQEAVEEVYGAADPIAEYGTLQRWMKRGGRQERKYKYNAGHSPFHDLTAKLREAVALMPTALAPEALGGEPLDVEEVAEFFAIFHPRGDLNFGAELMKALNIALSQADLDSTSVLLEGLVRSKLQLPGGCRLIGEFGLRKCATADAGAVMGFAWALDAAREGLRPEAFSELIAGFKMALPVLGEEQRRLLAWSCAEVGLTLPEIFGRAPFTATAEAGRRTFDALEALAARQEASFLSLHPVPVLSASNVVSQEHMEALIRLADEGDLWQPSARKGKGHADSGAPVEGRPWSALLDRESHLMHPAVYSVRLWVADAFDVAPAQVEPLRIVRYRGGEGSPKAHADAKPPSDASLFLQGQRTSAVMINLRTLPEEAGGETLFPQLLPDEGGLAVRPVAGEALLWPTVDRDGRPDPLAARMSPPVAAGHNLVKYAVLTWVRSFPAPGGIVGGAG